MFSGYDLRHSFRFYGGGKLVVGDDVIHIVQRTQMIGGGSAEFGAVAKKYLFRCVTYHSLSDNVFFLKAVVYLTVLGDGLGREKGNVGVKATQHLLGVMSDQY